MNRTLPTPWKPTKAQILAAHNRLVPDLASQNLIVLFAGINPGLYTAAVGRHFGRPGNRFWPALHGGGFTPRLFSLFEASLLLDLKFGITNIVERATARADELTDDELRAGGQRLQAKVKRWRPTVVAFVGIHVVLPRYVDCLPAFLVLLPGAVSMSISKVLGGYVAGRGRPGLLAGGMIAVLALNVGLNLVFIPMYGIVGASLSSLVSYTVQAGIVVYFTSRLSGQRAFSLFVPGPGEVHLVVETVRRFVGHALARSPGSATQGRR